MSNLLGRPLNSNLSPAIFPLISTTASLSFAIFEILVFRGLVSAASIDRSAAARTISAWWKATYFQGLSLIVTIGTYSLASGVLAIRSYVPWSSPWWIAVAGTTFAVGHFAFAPVVVPVIDAMAAVYDNKGKPGAETDRAKDERSISLQKQWNRVHLIRSLVVDLPAMLCFTALALWEH